MALRGNPALRELLGPTVAMLGCELVAIEFFPQGRGQMLRVYIDKDGGVTVDDCERVSHQISGVLDVEEVIEGHYVLEVSSPGLDRPLVAERDFERFSGHDVRLRTDRAIGGQRNFRGLLRGVRDGLVVLEAEGREFTLPLERIEKARLVPDI